MNHEDFLKAYETALASQNWKIVEPLIANNACVTFSNGVVHQGKQKVQIAFENNFATIKGEKYIMENITWLKKEPMYAVYLFQFNWSGFINNKLVSGSGIGTSVIIKEDESWKKSSIEFFMKRDVFFFIHIYRAGPSDTQPLCVTEEKMTTIRGERFDQT